MPFVQRLIEPKHLSKISLFEENGSPKISDEELQAVTNTTLCNALKQLASLALVADDIFKTLGGELRTIYKRSEEVRTKIAAVEERVNKYDPKKVPVPEGDICSFAQLKDHYVSKHPVDTDLFKVDTRPDALKALYEAASKTPVIAMRQLDRWRRDGCRSSRFFVCTPVLEAKRRKIRSRVDIDIETRMPQAVTELRRWTSDEALGDVTVGPNCTSRITSTLTDGDMTDGTICSDDEGVDHKLPSPEEQVQVVALRFPAEVVAVDISGKSFDRMSSQRRSLMTGDMLSRTTQDSGDISKRRTRTRRGRSRRRNTLAGTDQKEIENALTHGGEELLPSTSNPNTETINHTVPRSKSSDLLRSNSSKRDGSLDVKKSHFNTLKLWGKSQYDKIMNKSGEKSENNSNHTSKSKITSTEDVDDFNLYETITMKRRKDFEKERKTHERNSSISSSEKSIPVSNSNNLLSAMVNTAVKLRDSSLQRRQRRAGANKDEIHSSSGNWSASSESGRASIGSEITTSTTHPRSTTSAATSSNSLNVPSHAPNSVNSRRRFNVNTSTSGSVTSEGTLTPDIIHDLLEDDGSVYSCDTEGYYTSFHMDSGLKTLKEEDFPSPTSPLQSTSVFSRSGSNNTVLTAENEYELFGKGSTSTTTSSAGTVCTTLRAADSQKSIALGPAVPERKSSLTQSSKSINKSPDTSLEREKTGTIKRSPMISSKPTVVAMVHKSGDISPDSGHNTSSSPIESVSSPNGIRSGSDFEYSENSDFEGAERIERIRVKTTINSSRIPSMCVITPPHSDDESSSNSSYKKQNVNMNHVNNNVLETDLDNINGNNVNTRIINTGEKFAKISVDQRTGYATVENTTIVASGDRLSMICVDKRTGYATLESIDQPDGKILPANTNLKSGANMRAPSPSGGSMIVRNEPLNSKLTNIRAPSPSGGTVTVKEEKPSPKSNVQPMIKASLMPLNNMFGKLRTNIANFANKRDRSKSPGGTNNSNLSVEENSLDSGEYVTIADVRNNNEKFNENISYVNDMVNKNLNTVLSGKIRDTEYVSLNELPSVNENNNITSSSRESSLERKRRQGARVTLDAEGKVVYSSDSLRKRKSAHTTFEPGPFIKTTTTPVSSPLLPHRVVPNVRPVTNQQEQRKLGVPNVEFNRPMSPHRGKMVIKASGNQGVEFVRTPATVVSPGSPKSAPKQPKGAYVHVQTGGGPLSPKIGQEGVITPTDLDPNTQGLYRPNFAPEMYHYMEKDPYYHQNNPYYQKTEFYQLPNQDARSMYPQERYFSTLPSKKSQFFNLEHPPERSVTPDITRGLERSPHHRIQQFRSDQNVSYMTQNQFQLPQLGIPVGMHQIDTMKYQKVPHYPGQKVGGLSQENLHSTDKELYSRDRIDARSEESFKVSPIDPVRSSGGLKSSTPAQLKASTNLESQLSSPKKSTMSHEELYAVIHKSKKKLNIEDDVSRSSPITVLNSAKANIETTPEIITKKKEVAETGYIGSRQSWSPSKGEYIDFQTDLGKLSPPNVMNEPQNRQSWAPTDKKAPKKTSTMDFKRLLLSKSGAVSGVNKKISAVEQLKLSKQKMEQQKNFKTETDSNVTILDLSSSPRSLTNRRFFHNQPKSPENVQSTKIAPPSKILSPRSQWRFNSPRTDVLSSTILEDSKEDDSSTNSSLEKKSVSKSPTKNKANSPIIGGNVAKPNIMRKLPEISGDAPKSLSPKNIMSYREKSKENVEVVIPETPSPKRTAIGSGKDNFNTEDSTKFASVSQRLQAQRAQFFNNSSSEAQTVAGNKEKISKLPPTLETAF